MKTRLVMLFAVVLFVALPATAATADPPSPTRIRLISPTTRATSTKTVI